MTAILCGHTLRTVMRIRFHISPETRQKRLKYTSYCGHCVIFATKKLNLRIRFDKVDQILGLFDINAKKNKKQRIEFHYLQILSTYPLGYF